jgi:hypothetical protein
MVAVSEVSVDHRVAQVLSVPWVAVQTDAVRMADDVDLARNVAARVTADSALNTVDEVTVVDTRLIQIVDHREVVTPKKGAHEDHQVAAHLPVTVPAVDLVEVHLDVVHLVDHPLVVVLGDHHLVVDDHQVEVAKRC